MRAGTWPRAPPVAPAVAPLGELTAPGGTDADGIDARPQLASTEPAANAASSKKAFRCPERRATFNSDPLGDPGPDYRRSLGNKPETRL